VVHDERPEDQDAGPATTSAPGIRASDEERAQVVAALQRAGGGGRLTLEEVDQRTAVAYAARLRDELDPLIADLPVHAAATAPTPTGWLAVWHGVLRQSRATLLGVTADAAAAPTRRQQVLGVLAVATSLIWLALWILVGFGIGVIG
jgi:hypothetical protein